MAQEIDTLRHYMAESPVAILTMLLQQAGADNFPLVSLYARNGHSFYGRALAMEHSGSDKIVLLQIYSDKNTPTESTLYVSCHHIEALIVHESLRYAPILSHGKVPRARDISSDETLTRLGLKRLVGAIDQELRQEFGVGISVQWEGMVENQDCYLNLRDLAQALKAALFELGSDDLGRSALEGESFEVRHQSDKVLDVIRRGEVLQIVLDIQWALPANLENELGDLINRFL